MDLNSMNKICLGLAVEVNCKTESMTYFSRGLSCLSEMSVGAMDGDF